MKNILFVGWQDVRFQLRDGTALLWLFIMPPIFFYFIGTVSGGFSSGTSGGEATPVTVVAPNPGFLKEQLDLRLVANDFAAEWLESPVSEAEEAGTQRTLSFDPDLSDRLLAREGVTAIFDTEADSLRRQFEEIRIYRALYTTIADIVVAESLEGELSRTALDDLNNAPRVWQLEVTSAGQRKEVPRGFQQAIPGMLVMFTILVLLTSGATALVQERSRGLLRRLAAAPISRTEVIAGKWEARMILAIIQIVTALLVGTYLFRMDWGPDFVAVLLVLLVWGSFCASAGLWLGTIAKTEAQASGLGVVVANVLAALGGCWWPIEITPAWMQALQKITPTGWTMDALHKLISFQAGPVSVVPNLLLLLVGAVGLAFLAIRRFEYQ